LTIGDASPEEVELLVLSSLRTSDLVLKAAAAGIRDESWQVDDHARAWEYMLERARVGDQPTPADVGAVTGVALRTDVADAETYMEELLRRTVERLAISAIGDRAELFKQNPQKAIELLVGDLSEIGRNSTAHTTYFDDNRGRRLELLRQRAEQRSRGELIGLRTGLKLLDSRGLNWRQGDVVAIQGPLNVGKSTLLLWTCAYTYFYDRSKVLFLTPESTITDIEDRLDPMMARFMGFRFSNLGLRNGTNIDFEQYEAYQQAIAADGRADWITRDAGDMGAFSITEILQQIREHRPDVVAIDGVHLIDGGGKSWENMQAASKAIKGAAQHDGLVVIGGTQVKRDAVAAADDPAGLEDSAYGMAFMEAANKVISLGTKKSDPMQRVWKMPKNRDGEKITDKQYLRFDVDSGDIGDLVPNIDEGTGIVDWDLR